MHWRGRTLKPRSLRLRLIVGAAVWICLALVLAGISISYLFATNVEQRIGLDLAARLNRLAAVIDPGDFLDSLSRPLDDPRYETPFGGLYWQVASLDPPETARSRSLWDHELRVPLENVEDGEPLYAVMPGPAGQTLSALARLIRYPAEAKSYLVIVAEDRAALSVSVSRFRNDLALALGILGFVLMAAAWLQVGLGLRPLKAIRHGVHQVRSGQDSRLCGDFPSEVQPLAEEVNDLLRSQETSIAFARSRASDLAHGLKTPLAVLATTASGLRAKGDDQTARLLDELVGDMADKVDYQLRLSRLRMRTGTLIYSASVADSVNRVIGVLKRTREGEELRWETEIDPELTVNLDSHDLVELLGVILENAAKWGRSVVAVRARRNGGMAAIIVEDDGPGLPAGRVNDLGKRGHRLDETKAGAGLGLAIAKEIVSLNNGEIEFGPSAQGGLAVRLALQSSVRLGRPEPRVERIG